MKRRRKRPLWGRSFDGVTKAGEVLVSGRIGEPAGIAKAGYVHTIGINMSDGSLLLAKWDALVTDAVLIEPEVNRV